MKKLLLAALLVSCSPAFPSHSLYRGERAQCTATCVDTGKAVTASHCIDANLPDPISEVPGAWCGAIRMRDAIAGETVIIRGYPMGFEAARTALVLDSNWMGWTLVMGPTVPGESGGGVYGLDGALLAIVIETHEGVTYARIP